MPASTFTVLLLGVLSAGGLTVWLISTLGTTALLIAVPFFMLATVLVNRWRK